jgi:dUTP pyrophosphatase
MKVKIKRFDKDIPAPVYKSGGAACVDMYARTDVIIPAGKIGYIPLNVALEIPEGCFSLLASRSGTHKLGLVMANGIGILDHDYCGDNDEYIYAGLNVTDAEIKIEKGTRVCQLVIMKYERMEFEEVDQLGNADRSGFGSTGYK